MNETLVPTTDLNHAGHSTNHLDPNVASVSLLTPPGRGAVATIRVDGPTGLDGHVCPWEVGLAQSFVPSGRRSIQRMLVNGILFGRWIGPQKEDEKTPEEDVVLTRRGENSFEIHCHGGHVAVRRIMSDLTSLGCVEVSWQDQLAFRTDLLEAECVAALSQTTTARTAALVMEQANGRLRETFVCLNSLAKEGLTAELVMFLDGLLASSRFGLHLTRPWSVVLTGRPNVGKSSLINRLLGYERAIVFDQPGTTRDVVTGETAFDGWPVLLADTAGIRTAPEELEAAGIALARQRLQTADLRLVLIDLSQAPTEDDERLLADWPDALVVAHKCDLDATPSLWEGRLPPSALRVSSTTGEGIEALQKQLVQRLVPAVPPPGILLLLTERQVKLFTAIRRAVEGEEHSLVTQLCRELIDGEVR